MRGGAYRILEPLCAGGMGALYLAADSSAFDRKCVVKELLDYYDPTDPDEARKAQARFETEARLLAELSHPSIPRIYSYFSEAGRYYIVMEYIEGETLEQAVTHQDAAGRTISARSLPQEEIVRHAIRVCDVLEYLAGQPKPVIHHDVKPANLIVDRTSGEVRLVDFGTARTRTPWATQARLGRGASSVFGTEGYAAPEQFQGRSEPRSDVYALAATVYHLLTDDDPGGHPFQFPQLSTLPGPLSDALGRALRPELRRRSTALEFRQALQAWLVPEDAGQPFVFRNRAIAHNALELAALCDQNWTEACEHLQQGDFDLWFRARNRYDLIAKAKSARLEEDVNAALEAFLRRLNPRLALPQMAVEPLTLDFGRVNRKKDAVRSVTVRNDGRGYGQMAFNASVPWIGFDPPEAGCLAGEKKEVKLQLAASALPLRREHLAIVTCTSARGARISVPVQAELDLLAEAWQRLAAGLRATARLVGRGARWGIKFWTSAFRELLRWRYGPWLLVGELAVLTIGLIALWMSLRGLGLSVPTVTGLSLALTLALLAVYLLPALLFVIVGILRETALLAFGRRSHVNRPVPAPAGGRQGKGA